MTVQSIPEGYHSVTPYLIVGDGAAALEFYAKAFGATELFRLPMPNGKLGHAEFQIGNSRLMLSDEFPEMLAVSPKTLAGSPVGFCLYLDDVDAAFAKAVAAGATIDRPVVDQFYGDRSGTVVDPFGHKWTLSTHIEDVSEEEMGRRMAAMAG